MTEYSLHSGFENTVLNFSGNVKLYCLTLCDNVENPTYGSSSSFGLKILDIFSQTVLNDPFKNDSDIVIYTTSLVRKSIRDLKIDSCLINICQ